LSFLCNSLTGINSLSGIAFIKVDLEKLKFFEVPSIKRYLGLPGGFTTGEVSPCSILQYVRRYRKLLKTRLIF